MILKYTHLYLLNLVALFICLAGPVNAQEDLSPIETHPPTDLIDDWKLAMQFWTFNKISFFEAMDKTYELGLSWFEAYPGQKLSQHEDVVFNHELPKEYRQKIKQKMSSMGVRIINYGVVNLPGDEEECRKVFEFAKDMGIQTLISEPEQKYLSMIDTMCQEYDIKVALHNHPKPSRYWNPDTVLNAIRDHSSYIGVCADLGHWIRSGIMTLVGIKKLQGRIITYHFKDVKDYKPDLPDVIWWQGTADLDLVIEQMRNNGFKGVVTIEYERETPQLMQELRTNIKNFYLVASAYKNPSWKYLLREDLSNCVYKEGSWSYENGILSANGGADIWTKNVYGNFILDLQFKILENGNSGIFLRTGDIKEWLHTAIELQILDSYGNQEITKHDCGAIFDCLAPAKNMVNPAGEWNRYTITCTGNKIYVVLNGEQIINMDLDQWTEAGKNPDGTDNKFKYAYKDMPRRGAIGFQYHGNPVWFRNITLRRLDLPEYKHEDTKLK